MILIYRPELDNPPMDKECTIGFSFIGKGAQTEYVSIKSGVHREFSPDLWDRIKDYEVVKRLLSLGAMTIKEDTEVTEAPAPASPSVDASITNLPLTEAMELIEASMDPDQLNRWNAKDQRIRVKNAITKRLTAIAEGNG